MFYKHLLNIPSIILISFMSVTNAKVRVVGLFKFLGEVINHAEEVCKIEYGG